MKKLKEKLKKRLCNKIIARVPLSFFAAIGTKKEKAILTWTHEQLYPQIVKAKILLYTLVDERWSLC